MLLLLPPPPHCNTRQLCRAAPPVTLSHPGDLLSADARPDGSFCSRANEESGATVHEFTERWENLTPPPPTPGVGGGGLVHVTSVCGGA